MIYFLDCLSFNLSIEFLMCCERKVMLKKTRELSTELVRVLLKFEHKGCVEDNPEVEGTSDR